MQGLIFQVMPQGSKRLCIYCCYFLCFIEAFLLYMKTRPEVLRLGGVSFIYFEKSVPSVFVTLFQRLQQRDKRLEDLY